MIEGAENTLQLAVLILCAAVALYRAVALRSRRWTLLSFFYISWVLGDCYWLLCVIFYGDTPRISVVSDLSWYVSYVLLYLMLRQIAPPEECAGNRILPWLGPLFTGAMVPVFIRWGNIPGNLICAVLMGLLLFAAIWRLSDRRHENGVRPLCVCILIFCLLEYAQWTASSFWWDETLRNPYYWAELLMTFSFPLMIPATRRAAEA